MEGGGGGSKATDRQNPDLTTARIPESASFGFGSSPNLRLEGICVFRFPAPAVSESSNLPFPVSRIRVFKHLLVFKITFPFLS